MKYFTNENIPSLIHEGYIDSIITLAQEHKYEIEFLTLMNENKRTSDLVNSALSFFREYYGLEAVEIRLQREEKL